MHHLLNFTTFHNTPTSTWLVSEQLWISAQRLLISGLQRLAELCHEASLAGGAHSSRDFWF